TREGGEGGTLATAIYRYAVNLMDFVGRIDEVRTLALEAAELAEASGDLNALHWALHQLAFAHYIRGEWGPCCAYADRAVAVAERRGDPGPLEVLIRERGLAAFYMGDWALARRHFERSRSISHQLAGSYPHGDAQAPLPLARLALAEGHWGLAAQASADAWE